MSLSMLSLLVHEDDVPASARAALRAAYASPEPRRDLLESAARILHRDADLACEDARALVGLSFDGSCR